MRDRPLQVLHRRRSAKSSPQLGSTVTGAPKERMSPDALLAYLDQDTVSIGAEYRRCGIWTMPARTACHGDDPAQQGSDHADCWKANSCTRADGTGPDLTRDSSLFEDCPDHCMTCAGHHGRGWTRLKRTLGVFPEGGLATHLGGDVRVPHPAQRSRQAHRPG